GRHAARARTVARRGAGAGSGGTGEAVLVLRGRRARARGGAAGGDQGRRGRAELLGFRLTITAVPPLGRMTERARYPSLRRTETRMSMDGLEDDVAERRGRLQLVYPLGEPPPAGEAREIAPGVYWVRMPLPFALQWINLWLIEDGEGWTIVDTGVALEQSREYWRAIFDATLRGKPVKRVICTHMHPDHMGLAGWICRKFNATLWMSRLEYITGRMLVADTGREAPEEGVEFYRAAGWDENALDSYKVRFGGFGKAVSKMPDAFKRMEDGDVVEIGGRPWRVITGNGHCPEHVC